MIILIVVSDLTIAFGVVIFILFFVFFLMKMHYQLEYIKEQEKKYTGLNLSSFFASPFKIIRYLNVWARMFWAFSFNFKEENRFKKRVVVFSYLTTFFFCLILMMMISGS